MVYKRTIKYQYYQILMVHREQEGRKKKDVIDGCFKFPDWAKSMRNQKMIKTAIKFGTAMARIEECSVRKGEGIWGLRIMKLRDTNIPAKAKDNEAAKAIELEEGEYIGEDLFVIYDYHTGIAMIQQNRLSLGISRIEEFLQYTYNTYTDSENTSRISIEPILEFDRVNQFAGNYKQLEISFANLNDYTAEGDTALSTIIKPFKNMYGITGTIKVGLGRTKNDTLNRTEIVSLVGELESNKRFVRSAKIKLQEEEDADVEIIDLFEEICHDFITFEIEERTLLSYEYAIAKMRQSYKERRNELCRYTTPGAIKDGKERMLESED